MHNGYKTCQDLFHHDGYTVVSVQAASLTEIEMSLFPRDDVLAREIEAWKGFADGLLAEDRKIFYQMLNQCYKHIRSINAKGETFPTESVLMSLILSQQQLIEYLLKKIKSK